MLFRDVSGEVILKLESLLNPDSINNWKRLGVELQLSQTLLQNFKSTSEMLSHWQTSNDATTQKLYAALKHIGRDDACKYLEENATSSCRETNVQIWDHFSGYGCTKATWRHPIFERFKNVLKLKNKRFELDYQCNNILVQELKCFIIVWKL